MRSIMAEAEKTKPGSRAPARPGIYTPPMMAAVTPSNGTPAGPSIVPSGQAGPTTPGTWRTASGTGTATGASTPMKASSPSASAFPSLSAPRPPATTPGRPSLLAQSRTSSPLPSSGPSSRRPSGPVVTPVKPPLPEVIVPTRGKIDRDRRKTSEPAWSTAPIFQPAPVLPYVAASPHSGSGVQVSLLDIQRAELQVQQAGSLRLAPMSIAEIQAEERKTEQERAAQLEFERWWAAEEERVRAEQRRMTGMTGGGGASGGPGGGGSGSGGRGGSSRRKGRGGGGGGEGNRGGCGRGGGTSGGTALSGGRNRNAMPTAPAKTAPGPAGRGS